MIEEVGNRIWNLGSADTTREIPGSPPVGLKAPMIHGAGRGSRSTIVEEFAPEVFEVEFCDREGRTLGFAELRRGEFLVLHHEPALAA